MCHFSWKTDTAQLLGPVVTCNEYDAFLFFSGVWKAENHHDGILMKKGSKISLFKVSGWNFLCHAVPTRLYENIMNYFFKWSRRIVDIQFLRKKSLTFASCCVVSPIIFYYVNESPDSFGRPYKHFLIRNFLYFALFTCFHS